MHTKYKSNTTHFNLISNSIYEFRVRCLVEELVLPSQHEGNLHGTGIAMHACVQDMGVQIKEEQILQDILVLGPAMGAEYLL